MDADHGVNSCVVVDKCISDRVEIHNEFFHLDDFQRFRGWNKKYLGIKGRDSVKMYRQIVGLNEGLFFYNGNRVLIGYAHISRKKLCNWHVHWFCAPGHGLECMRALLLSKPGNFVTLYVSLSMEEQPQAGHARMRCYTDAGFLIKKIVSSVIPPFHTNIKMEYGNNVILCGTPDIDFIVEDGIDGNDKECTFRLDWKNLEKITQKILALQQHGWRYHSVRWALNVPLIEFTKK